MYGSVDGFIRLQRSAVNCLVCCHLRGLWLGAGHGLDKPITVSADGVAADRPRRRLGFSPW